MTLLRLKTITCGAVFMIVIALGAPSALASAAPPPGSGGGVSSAAVGAGGALATATTGITCTWSVPYAHKSTTVPENVNVHGSNSCTAAMAQMFISLTLYKVVCDPGCWDAAYGATGKSTTYGKSYVTTTSAGPCTNGVYYGAGYIVETFPPGYVPNPQNVQIAGAAQAVTC